MRSPLQQEAAPCALIAQRLLADLQWVWAWRSSANPALRESALGRFLEQLRARGIRPTLVPSTLECAAARER